MQIVELSSSTEEWKRFLQDNQHMIIHTPQWKEFIQATFKHTKPIYLAAIQDNLIKAIFPLFLLKHPLTGKRIISSAFLEYGGPAGSEDAVREIISYIKQDHPKDVDYLEVRQGLYSFDDILKTNLEKIPEYKRFILPLKDPDSTWNKIERSKRKGIKKSVKVGIITKELGLDNLDEIYRIYVDNMRSFGSPPFSKRYFINFFKIIAAENSGKCFGAYLKEKLIGVLLGFNCEKTAHIVISVYDHRFIRHRPNDAVHWHYMRWAMENGFNLFDFGRVREESGQFTFKKEWGSELKELNHYYMYFKDKKRSSFDPKNPRYRFIINIWKRVPIPIIKLVGPSLREGLGI